MPASPRLSKAVNGEDCGAKIEASQLQQSCEYGPMQYTLVRLVCPTCCHIDKIPYKFDKRGLLIRQSLKCSCPTRAHGKHRAEGQTSKKFRSLLTDARPPLLEVGLSNQFKFAWDRGSQSLAACPHPAALGKVAPAFEKANLAAARSYLLRFRGAQTCRD